MGQIISVSWQNLRSLPQRMGASLVAIVGVAGVVAVLVAVLSMAKGFEQTMTAGGSPENVIVLRSGSSSELDSGISGTNVKTIESAPGLLVEDGRVLASPEVYVMVDLTKKKTGTTANVPFRGVGPNAPAIREQFQIAEGRMFETGKKELIAGRGAQSQYESLEVGQTLAFGQEKWQVVGIFESAGSSIESELWADAPVVQGAFRRGNSYAAVYARLSSVDQFETFKNALTTDPTLSAKVERELDYFSEQSEALTGFINGAGYGIAILMALGAVFGALNTMYTAVSDRAREIATLRALGFSRMPIVVSVLVEALLLSLVGGLIGSLAAYLLFNGFSVSTLNFASFTQIVFAFSVTPDLLLKGVFIALAIGLIGGFAPAIRAALQPIPTALRQT